MDFNVELWLSVPTWPSRSLRTGPTHLLHSCARLDQVERTIDQSDSPANENVTVLFADDHPFILNQLTQFLNRQPGLTVIASLQDGEAALANVRLHRPLIALLDINMPVLDGLE